MALMVCRNCSTRFAVGLRMCPQCTSERAFPDYEEEFEMGKSSNQHGTTVEGDDGVTRAVADDGTVGDPIDQVGDVSHEEHVKGGYADSGCEACRADASHAVSHDDPTPPKKATPRKASPRKSTSKTA